MKKSLLLTFILMMATIAGFAQNQAYSYLDNLHPVTPSAYQFVKYTEMPVSEYTGMPNISIPLYEINVDGVKVPLDLTYHAGGIRVNEEASWVGLGWDLQVGSIVQQINDQDDYEVIHRMLPDYYNTSQPIEFPFKWAYCTTGGDFICNYGCNGPLSVNTPIKAEGFVIYTDNYAPFNGNYNQQDPNNFFDSHYYYSVDSEPDIFTANFLGHSFKFIVDWNTGQPVVLDKKGYQVTRTPNSFKVLVPSGEEYDFALENTVQSMSESDAAGGFSGGGSSFATPSSNIWMLTQIITKNNRVITFNYNVPSQTYNCYPSFSQKRLIATLSSNISSGNSYDWLGSCTRSAGTSGGVSTATIASRTYSQETFVTLSSITFPNGQVTFTTDNNRNDVVGGYKLDNVTISAAQQIKSYNFNYDYFDATTVGGNTYNSIGGSVDYGTAPLYRLRLSSLQDNSGANYAFTYNSTPLPAKNSFAIDYWGYYNGQTSNTTFVPNSAQFPLSNLENNGDNHSANSTYTQAGILQQIKYPTGGSVNFIYELNQFDNYWVPDFSSSTNTISSGNGLRVQSVTFLDANNAQLKKTNYTYSGGLAILPVNMFRNYNYSTTGYGNFIINGVTGHTIASIYAINEINMAGMFSSNPFASINGVGYSTVTKTDVDINGNPNGKEVSNYYNTPDLEFNSTVGTLSQVDASLPAYKNSAVSANNGSLQSDLIYDQNNNLLKRIDNTYFNVQSPLYYGARMFGYGNFIRYTGNNSDGVLYQNIKPQTMIGYYPIFDFETLLSSKTETDYFGTNNTAITENYVYDQYNQIASITKNNSDLTQEVTGYTYPYNAPSYVGTSPSVLADMTSRNRLSDVITMGKAVIKPTTTRPTYSFERDFQEIGNLILPSRDVIDNRPGSFNPTITTYDQFDPANGNLLQYTAKNLAPGNPARNISSSVLWGYNGTYPIAEVTNAPLNDVFYENFESGNGNGFYNDSKTGHFSYNGANVPYQKTISGLDNGNYKLSYWLKSTTDNTWSLNTIPETPYYDGTGYSFQIVISGQVDDVRLYPAGAQMTTYTYDPLIGMTSSMDAKGLVSYYEYDPFGRLRMIKDKDGNIVKAFCYNFLGQSYGCLVPQNDHPQIVYAQMQVNDIVNSGGYDGSGYDYNATGNVSINFYSDPQCTQPFILQAGITVTVEEVYDTDDDVNGLQETLYYNDYIVPAGVSSYTISTGMTIYDNYSYYDSYWNYHYTNYNYGFLTVSNSSLSYIPE